MDRQNRAHVRPILKAPGFWISVVLSILLMLFYGLSQPELGVLPSFTVLEMIETKALDIRFYIRGEKPPGDDVVIIAVDEKTEDELGRWQSAGRQWIAELLRLLHEAGVSVVGFDLTLAEPDEGTALMAIDEFTHWYLQQVHQDVLQKNRVSAYLDEMKANHDYDSQLVQAIQEAGNVILGIYHFLDPLSASHLSSEKQTAYRERIKRVKYSLVKYPPGSERQALRLVRSYGVEPNLPAFSEAANSFGHFNVLSSYDGYIRYAPLLIEYMGEYYPSLDLEISRAYLGMRSPPMIYALGKEGGGHVSGIQLDGGWIPTDEEGKLFINYYGPASTFPYYSFADVISGKIPLETFTHKIVLLGFTSAICQDLHSTTFQAGTYPGVEIHATIIENILRNDFLLRPQWTIVLNALMVLCLGIFLGVALHYTRPYQGAVIAISCVLVFSVLVCSAFIFQKIWLNFTFPFLFILLDYLVMTTYKYFGEERKKKQLRNLFQRYVSPDVVEQMLNTVDQVRLGGERKELTALFSDIRGFTSIAEKMAPEELVRFLNEYLSAMTKIVLSYKGTVDKYMGDAIMAFYGAPVSQKEHAVMACRTAVDMIQRLKELQQDWQTRQLPPIEIGIGINSGEMSIGNIGSEERFDYTILGDNVNLASRLEGLNKQYKTNILISQFTYQHIRHDHFIVRELDSVVVKGKKLPVVIYELQGYERNIDEQHSGFLQLFAEGLQAYKTRQWERAISLFQQGLTFQPEDFPSHLYIKRCETFKYNPPPEDWDTSFVMTTK